MLPEMERTADMELSYKVENGRAVIEKVEDGDRTVVVPEELEGCPVTELGTYVLAGSDVEELYLPSRLVKIGAYAFYNCQSLKRITCSSRAVDLGTGLFAGVQTVEYLDITLFPGERSCLKELLSELRQTLRVRVREREPGGREARLIFPEYYEDSVENTPARIVSIETHGCGHRYRYCFQNRVFQYRDYDSIFPHMKVQEPEALAAELAFGRLRYPLELGETARQEYRAFLAEHWQAAGQMLIDADRLSRDQVTNLEPGQLPWFVEQVLEPGAEADWSAILPAYIAMAQKAGDTEMVSWLMDYQHRRGGAGTRSRRFRL